MLHTRRIAAPVFGLILAFTSIEAQTVSTNAVTLANHTSAFVKSATSIGRADPSQTADITVWLQLHNREALDQLAADLYNPKSPQYHNWLSRDAFRAAFAPTEDERKSVESLLTSQGLSIVQSDQANLYVRARGTLGAIAAAFSVDINNYSVDGQTFYANANNPTIRGAAASLIRSVSGLDNFTFQHHNIAQKSNLKARIGSNAFAASPAAATSPADAFSACFSSGPVTESYSSPGFPMATYTGLRYGSYDSPGCGYTPAQIQAAYGLDKLYAKGLDGTGQTIVIIDWCGSPTIQDDANVFSAQFGLPPLTSSNFNIIEYPTASTCSGADPEINIDVEWAHAVAPGAKITLLVPANGSFQDIDISQLYAEEQGLGSVISGSYGAEESRVSVIELDTESLIGEIGATFGIAANFSTGDSGDFTADNPALNPPSVSVPAAVPFHTGIGGVALALNSDNSVRFQTGWGNNQTLLREEGIVVTAPIHEGFTGGSGGGPSGFFAKPDYQAALPGTKRLLPDVSWLADPNTGVIILISAPFVFPPQQYEVFGGTSVACPMFSALWAIANQAAGHSLGQAAPLLYTLPSSAFYDIVPYSSPNNVTGTISLSAISTIAYSAASLAAPLGNTTTFLSALFDYPALSLEDTNFVLTFGTDTLLTTAVGWDNVTGLGVPNVLSFADMISSAGSNP